MNRESCGQTRILVAVKTTAGGVVLTILYYTLKGGTYPYSQSGGVPPGGLTVTDRSQFMIFLYPKLLYFKSILILNEIIFM